MTYQGPLFVRISDGPPGERFDDCAECGEWIYDCECHLCPDCGRDKDGPHWEGCQIAYPEADPSDDEGINEALAPKRRKA